MTPTVGKSWRICDRLGLAARGGYKNSSEMVGARRLHEEPLGEGVQLTRRSRLSVAPSLDLYLHTLITVITSTSTCSVSFF